MKTFEEMELFGQVQRALSEQGYEQPTPIQAKTIPAAMAGNDILGCAQTGTGKTAAFAIPILDHLAREPKRAKPNRPFVLALAPTRELAVQISASFKTYGKHTRFRQALVYGGVSQVHQVRSLKKGVHVLIATPGRLLDLIEQGHIDLSEVKQLVLDEADRMMDMGFMPALKQIVAMLPEDRQSLFFSATMPPKIRELAGELLFNPVSVNVTPKRVSVERIDQTIRFVHRGEKESLLIRTLTEAESFRAIVFTRTKRGADALTRKLRTGPIRAAAIHGDKSQNARQRALDAFRRKKFNVLVATDVAARGIDIDGVTHVINYDMPIEADSYVHRVGRTGRAGAEGIAISFCTTGEMGELRAIEKLVGHPLPIEDPDGLAKKAAKKGSKPRGRKPGGHPRSRNRGPASKHRSGKRPATGEVRSGGPRRRKKKSSSSRRPATTAS